MGQPKESDLKGLPRHVGDLPRAQGAQGDPHSLSFLLLPDCRCLEIVAMEATQNFVETSLGKKTESQEWQGGNSNLGGLITGSTLPTCALQLSKEESKLASGDSTLNLGGPRPPDYTDYPLLFLSPQRTNLCLFPETQWTKPV